MKRSFITIILSLIVCTVSAQFTINGIIKNKEKKPLSGASIIDATSGRAVSAEEDGSFSLSVEAGMHVLQIGFLGYQSILDTINITNDVNMNYALNLEPLLAEEFVLEATRADLKTPMSFQNLDKSDIEANNLGQDLPILLNQSISAVTTSDAGAGVGYTGMRIRGSDASSINVTVNGIPLNDAESHGVFWVNMPDFASSTSSIQIQRGIGSSTNGAGAFGASINLKTSEFDSNSFVEFNNSYGSFNTRKHNVIYNSGLIDDHFVFEGRLSYISSDGYIDRSSSDLRSYYLSSGYYHQKFLVKAVVFSGKELTHQAWYGTPESRVKGNDQEMLEHAANNGLTSDEKANLLESGRTYNYYSYDNEIDNYGQDHFQLITGFQILPKLYLNINGHYTRGKGYFEQWKPSSQLSDFGFTLPVFGTDTISTSDLVIQRWLDNHFYGGVYSFNYKLKSLEIKLGGSYNEYLGEHYGKVVWADYASTIGIDNEYYFSDSKKTDFSNYLRLQYQIGRVSLYADVQHRFIDYKSEGIDNDLRPILIDQVYHFINPKAGLSVSVNPQNSLYFSFAQASREPVRGDFVDAVVKPKPEKMADLELGWRYYHKAVSFGANGYFMNYSDQLVLTGEVNDVGSPIRTNVNKSYRLGLEAYADLRMQNGIEWQPNLTVSRNKIQQFQEPIYDYTNGFDVQIIDHKNTDISFSPSLIVGSNLGYKSDFGLSVFVLSKFVGPQFLDNTSSESRKIESYFVNDLRISYSIESKYWKNFEATLLINNFLNQEYESNGYTYSYIYGSLITENFYYPQAGTNWIAGLKWRF